METMEGKTKKQKKKFIHTDTASSSYVKLAHKPLLCGAGSLEGLIWRGINGWRHYDPFRVSQPIGLALLLVQAPIPVAGAGCLVKDFKLSASSGLWTMWTICGKARLPTRLKKG